MFFADTGTAIIWLARHIDGGRNRRLFGSFSWASMANAAPNAFGAQLAYPGRQTIALCGDGGFTMLGLGDVLTLVERKAPVVHILLNNQSLDFVSIEQQEAGYIPFGVAFKNPDFAAVAEAMGAKGMRIENPGDVHDGLLEALAHKSGPVVVDVVVDPYALAMPSHVPLHTLKGYTLSVARQVLTGKLDGLIKTAERNVRAALSHTDMPNTTSTKLRGWIVAIVILAIAIGLIVVLSSNWTAWASNSDEQKTDDAYLRADVTPLSTKAAGLVASVEVSDYQRVKAGQLLARLQDDDYRAQVAQAAASGSGRASRAGQQQAPEGTAGCPGTAGADRNRFVRSADLRGGGRH